MTFEWDRHNLRKIHAHGLSPEEVEQALENDPILAYEQIVDEELRFVYYGETTSGRMLAVVVTERDDRLRVVTSYDLDAGQKRDYLQSRYEGS